jgi:hypothetical protein
LILNVERLVKLYAREIQGGGHGSVTAALDTLWRTDYSSLSISDTAR